MHRMTQWELREILMLTTYLPYNIIVLAPAREKEHLSISSVPADTGIFKHTKIIYET